MHHVVTNEVGSDPDIDLAPVFTYMNKHVSLNFAQRFQHIYFLPLVAQLHFMWMTSSLRHTVARRMWGRCALLLLNHAFMLLVVYRSGSGQLLWPHLLVASVFKVRNSLWFWFFCALPPIS